MSEWKEFLNEQLQSPVVKKEWDALEPESYTIQAIINARKENALKSNFCQ